MLVAACPWCYSNFSDVIEKDGESVEMTDIAELLAMAVK